MAAQVLAAALASTSPLGSNRSLRVTGACQPLDGSGGGRIVVDGGSVRSVRMERAKPEAETSMPRGGVFITSRT